MTNTDVKQIKVALFFTELKGCKTALGVCMDLYAIEQTPYIKRIRSALKDNKRKQALLLMEYWLSCTE